MNYDKLIGNGWKPVRILLWTLFWFFVFIFVTYKIGMSGLVWSQPWLKPYMMRHEADNWMHNAFSIYQLKKISRDVEKIVFINGSVCLESITSDQKVSDLLSLKTGIPVKFTSICAPYQNFADEFRVVNALDDFGGTIIFVTEPGLWGKPPDRLLQARSKTQRNAAFGYFYLPVPEELRGFLSQNDLNLPFFFKFQEYWALAPDTIFAFAKRLLLNRPSPEYRRHRIKEPREKKVIQNALEEIEELYQKNNEFNFSLRKLSIDNAIKNGNKIVLLEIPNNIEWIHYVSNFKSSYDKQTQNIINKYGTAYINLQDKAIWDDHLFWDSHHLSSKGREIFMPLFIDALSKIIDKN